MPTILLRKREDRTDKIVKVRIQATLEPTDPLNGDRLYEFEREKQYVVPTHVLEALEASHEGAHLTIYDRDSQPPTTIAVPSAEVKQHATAVADVLKKSKDRQADHAPASA